MEIIRVGVDLAKNVYQVHGVDRKDKPVWRRSLRRLSLVARSGSRPVPARIIGRVSRSGRFPGLCPCMDSSSFASTFFDNVKV